MTSEDIWDQFVETSTVSKAANIQGQLDTIAAQNNEMRVDMQRIADVIDQIRGDGAAMANAPPMDPMAMMGGAPPMGGMPPGMPPMGPEMGGAPPMGGEPGAEDMMPPDGAPGMDDVSGEGGIDISDEDIDNLIASLGGDASEAPPMPDAEGGAPMDAPMGGDAGLDMVSKIKDLIANESDPAQLRGLSDLLNMALGDVPAVSMESGVESSGIMKSDDDGIADATDSSAAEDATEVKLDDGPSETEPFSQSDESKPDIEIEAEVDAEPAPYDPESVMDQIVTAVTSAVADVLDICPECGEPMPVAECEECVENCEENGGEDCEEQCAEECADDVVNAEDDEDSMDDTEPFESCAKSFGESYTDHLGSTSFEDLLNERRPMQTTQPVVKSKLEVAEPKAQPDFVKSIKDRVEANGKHIQTLDEKLAMDHFVKSSAGAIARPDPIAVMGADRSRPTEDDLYRMGTESVKKWEGEHLEDYHKAMSDDWNRYHLYNTRSGF